MSHNWTFGRQLTIGYLLAGLTLLLVAWAGYRSTADLVANDREVTRTQVVRRELITLEAALADAETGHRGYIVTGEQSYLAPYGAALPVIKKSYGNLRRLGQGDPGLLRNVEAMGPLIDAKLDVLARGVALRKTGGHDAAVKLILSGEGKTIMEQIRAIAADANAAQARQFEARESQSQASARWAVAVIIWGGLLGAVLVGLSGWYIIASLTGRIGGAVALVQSSSSELQAAANQQASGAREQSSAMSEIATTIRELIATSRQIAESARSVADIASQTDRAAAAGDGTVTKANGLILGIRQQVDIIVNHMLDLGKKSQQIGAVLDIVSELAEQTNILAINATIEAAGAGESGRRFSVVADEIRKLADRVAEAAKEIRGLIDDVRAAANTTVMATESGSKAVDLGSRQFEEVASSFKQISGLVSTTTEAAREIELSTKQQSTAVEQVNAAISNVAQATKETEASSKQILVTASELTKLSLALSRLVRRQEAVAT
jgi:CHASE3 domain sensor protein